MLLLAGDPSGSPVPGPDPGPVSSFRDRDVWDGIADLVSRLGLFAAVRIGEWPRAAFSNAQDRPLCIVEPRGFTEDDAVDAIQIERTVRVRLTLVASSEEPSGRLYELDDLARAVGNALTGVSVAGATLPAKTSCPAGDFLETRHPDKVFQMNFTGPYLFDGYGGRAESE